ncbi:MAG TPA: 50S ribosomal protein L22 [Candidatus Paceibacterota bacterium]|nr:50S ribosomal protein L22 [Candidatus Paceibacterota bacterium]
MKAFLKNYRQSPRKVRLVADLVRGKKTESALVILDSLPKRASLPIKKLIAGAVSNALYTGAEKSNLFVKEIRVDKGIVMKRMMPRAMGRGARINKRTSHVTLVLGDKTTTATVSKPAKKIKEVKIVKEKKPAKKTTAK